MRYLGALLAASIVVGCSGEQDGHGDVDQSFSAQMASQSLAEVMPSSEGMRVAAVCGPSAGQGLYEDDGHQEFRADGITGGRTIFVSGRDGRDPNVIMKDASGQYINAAEDGAEIRILNGEATVWIVAYPSTGVVDTHNFITSDNQLRVLTTTNKPEMSVVGPSARIFSSNCFRP